MLKTLTLPAYLLEDQQLEDLIMKVQEVMLEAGTDQASLTFVAEATEELQRRGRRVFLREDGSFYHGA